MKKFKYCIFIFVFAAMASGCSKTESSEALPQKDQKNVVRGEKTIQNTLELQNVIKENKSESNAESDKDNMEIQENKIVTLKTSMGDIKIELYLDKMPITAQNFFDLAKSGFYNGTTFHRVIEGFMAQGGDPLSKDSNPDNDGTGGPGYFIADEFNSELSNIRGTIAMANAGPNTGGSQFFINVVNNTFLDPKHPVFGRVTEGMDVVDAIIAVPKDKNDRPIEDIIVQKVIVE